MRFTILTALAATLTTLCIVSFLTRTSDLDLKAEFTELIKSTGFAVSSLDDLDYRFSVFKDNKAYINMVNAQKLSYTLAVNKYSVYTFEEFKSLMGMVDMPIGDVLNAEGIPDDLEKTSVDWRSILDVTPVRDQTANCNAGYAFAAAGAVEAFVKKKRNVNVQLSPQELLDCSTSKGNHGCNGGYAHSALDYVAEKGLDKDSDYPYEAKQANCRSKPPFAGLGGYNMANNESKMLKGITNIPAVIAYEFVQEMQHYSGGIFVGKPECGKSNINQFGLASGYYIGGRTSDYWIIKNSFGAGWGDHGYIYLELYSCGAARNKYNLTLKE